MKKWLTGLLSGSPEDKKKGQKEMSKAKPAKAAAKSVKAAKSTAKPKVEPKAQPKEPKGKSAAPAKAATKAKTAPADEKAAATAVVTEPAAKVEKKPKKGAEKESSTNSSGLVDTATPENKKKWKELRDKFAKEKAPAYSMAAQFEADRPLEHKVLGWGYVMTNNNDRLEVLFETGVKILISNYRS